jgi:hypothetical protein
MVGVDNTVREHYHCKCSCEHPQPICIDNISYCGKCYFIYSSNCEMILCTPDT